MNTYLYLTGGLGNQLFQLSAGLALAEKYHSNIFLDATWYDNIKPGETPRSFYFKDFSHPAIKCFKKTPRIYKVYAFIDRVFRRLDIELYTSFAIYVERNFVFEDRFLSLCRPPRILRGFFHSHRYFSWSSSDKNNIVLRYVYDLSICKLINKNPLGVAIHVRRGDFVSKDGAVSFHGVCDTNYYSKALVKIAEKVSVNVSDLKIYIFTDDQRWVEENFKPTGMGFSEIVDLPSDIEEFHYLSSFENVIIANSSFSWWAAYSNNFCERKNVVVPSRWFSERSVDYESLFLSDWEIV